MARAATGRIREACNTRVSRTAQAPAPCETCSRGSCHCLCGKTVGDTELGRKARSTGRVYSLRQTPLCARLACQVTASAAPPGPDGTMATTAAMMHRCETGRSWTSIARPCRCAAGQGRREMLPLDCPVPSAQQPVMELKQLQDDSFLSWAECSSVDLSQRLAFAYLGVPPPDMLPTDMYPSPLPAGDHFLQAPACSRTGL